MIFSTNQFPDFLFHSLLPMIVGGKKASNILWDNFFSNPVDMDFLFSLTTIDTVKKTAIVEYLKTGCIYFMMSEYISPFYLSEMVDI